MTTPKIAFLKNVIEKHLCLGCGLCTFQGNTPMVFNSDGFLVPQNPELCDENFTQYCPAVKLVQTRKKNGLEVIYGGFVDHIMVGRATDAQLNYRASSGGVITALLLYLLDHRKIDGVLQVKASANQPWGSSAFFSTTREEIIDCAGSRYAPSSLFEHFEKILESHEKIAVVGKPCDIGGLQQFLTCYPKYKNKIHYTFSMMCMGLPSILATEELLAFLKAQKDQVHELRYRGYGWPGKATAVLDSGEEKTCSYIESWGAILGRDTLFRCKICPDGFGEFADVSCGDAWYRAGNEPSFENDDPGRSFVFSRTLTGAQLVKEATAAGYILLDRYPVGDLPVIQLSQYQRKIHVGIRYWLFKLLIERKIQFRGFRFLSLLLLSNPSAVYRDGRGFVGRYWRGYLKKKGKINKI